MCYNAGEMTNEELRALLQELYDNLDEEGKLNLVQATYRWIQVMIWRGRLEAYEAQRGTHG